MKKNYLPYILGGVALILIWWFVSTRNSFVTLEETVNEAWGMVEVQYQRRLDLIPNLVSTVKGYTEHESQTLQSVTNARAGLTNAYNQAKDLSANLAGEAGAPADAKQFNEYNKAQEELNRNFSIYVNAVKEAYPDLKADKQFQELQVQLEGTENRIATERGYYTKAVKEYNVAIRRFPASLIASLSGFDAKPQFEADAAAKSAPAVSF